MEQAQATPTEVRPTMFLQHLYVKDTSVEVPNAPGIFREQGNAEIRVDFDSRHTLLEGTRYEVELRVTAESRVNGKIAFVIEVTQAGIFEVQGIDAEMLAGALEVAAPNMLYPYIRAIVREATLNAGFPALLLQPINFDALAEAIRARRAEEAQAAAASGTGESSGITSDA